MSDRVFSALLVVGLMTASGPSRAESVAALFGGAEFRFGQTKAEYRQPGVIANVPVGGSTAVVTPIFTTGALTGIVGSINPGRFEVVKEYLKSRYAGAQCAPTRVYVNPNDPATGFTNEVCIFTADDGLILLSQANPVFLHQGMPATSFNPDISSLLVVRKEDAQTALRLIPHDGSKGTPPVAAPVVEPVESHDVAAAPSRSTDLTVFGLEIGKPVQLPECEFVMIGKLRSYSGVHSKTCVTESRDFYGGARARTLFFSFADDPIIVSGFAADLMLDQNGTLIGLEFSTKGISFQTIVLDRLTTKYGTPTSSATSHVQNRLGAQFDVLHAIWNLPGISVFFHGALLQLDEGRVTIDSPEAAKLRAAAIANSNQGKSL